MKEQTNQLVKESNEGFKILCLLTGMIGIILLIISLFTTPILIIISLILCILGIVFSAIYKSIAGLVVNIIGIVLIPIGLIVGVFLLRNIYNNVSERSKAIENMYNNINGGVIKCQASLRWLGFKQRLRKCLKGLLI